MWAASSATTEHCAQGAFEQISPGKPPHAARHKLDGRMSDALERLFERTQAVVAPMFVVFEEPRAAPFVLVTSAGFPHRLRLFSPLIHYVGRRDVQKHEVKFFRFSSW